MIKGQSAVLLKPKLLSIFLDAAERCVPVPSRPALAEMLRSSKPTIMACAKLLEESGLIVVAHHQNGYQVQNPKTGKWSPSNRGKGASRPGKGASRQRGKTVPQVIIDATPFSRKCLKCREKFIPEHKGRFICNPCSTLNKYDRLSDQWVYF